MLTKEVEKILIYGPTSQTSGIHTIINPIKNIAFEAGDKHGQDTDEIMHGCMLLVVLDCRTMLHT